MTATTAESGLPLLRRLWIYQAERFPLARTTLLLAIFSSSVINLSAQLSGRLLPPWPTYLVACLVAVIFFVQLRAFDEVKDVDDDRLYRPERPIPRGLVSLKLIVGVGIATVPAALLLTAALDIRLLLLLCVVWVWGALMTVEFFAPHWLKARPFLYLVSHMLILPLITLFITACEWLTVGEQPSPQLWLVLAMSFVNGCVVEIGRKIYAPINERRGVETYSALVGPRRATLLWCMLLVAACGFLIALGNAVAAPVTVVALGVGGVTACFYFAASFWRRLDSTAQRRLDQMSAMWFFVSYGAVGFAPLALRWT